MGGKGKRARWWRHGDEGGGVSVSVGVQISFSYLTKSQWQTDDCTLNTTLFLVQQAVVVDFVVLQNACTFIFPFQMVEVVEGPTKGKI